MLDTVLRNPGRSFATIYFPLVYVLPPSSGPRLPCPPGRAGRSSRSRPRSRAGRAGRRRSGLRSRRASGASTPRSPPDKLSPPARRRIRSPSAPRHHSTARGSALTGRVSVRYRRRAFNAPRQDRRSPLTPQGRDALHLLSAQLEVEDVEVALEVLLARGLGDGDDLLLLDQPAQCNLPGRLAMSLPYLC
jgi:hypothetical protein